MNKPLFFWAILLLSVFTAQAKTITLVAPSLEADFTADVREICAGDSVHFTDLTTENPTGWAWSFEGGSPSSSVAQNPVVAYNTPGVYKVFLKANNGEGTDEITKEEFIRVQFTPSSTFNITSASAQCPAGNSFSFANTGSPGTHLWNFSAASPVSSTALNPTGIVFNGPGTHSVQHKVTDGDCFSITVLDITLFSPPTALAVTTTASNCAGANGTISIGATTGGTAPFTYCINGSTFISQTFYTGKPAGTYTITVRDANGCSFTRTATVGSSGGPTAVGLTVTSSTCGNANGIITINGVTGGAGPYLFALDNGSLVTATTFSNISAGNHVVKVKDSNGCQFSQQVVVQNTFPSAIATTTTPSACTSSTGSITLGAVTGGRSPYTYSMNGNSFTTSTLYSGLGAGPHTLVVKDVTGCTLTVTITIPTAPPTAVAITTGSTACSASTGTITIGTVTGGTAPYTYSVNGSAFTSTTNYTNLASGSHTVVVKDSKGCTLGTTVSITSTQPTAAVINTTPTSCVSATGTIAIGTVTGGVPPFVYSVNNGAFTSATTYNNRPAGTYTVAVKDFNGCVLTQTVVISNTTPTGLAVSTTSTACSSNTGSVTIGTVTGGVAPFTYSFNNGAFSSATSFTALAAGIYNVTVKDVNGCTLSTSATVSSNGGPTAVVVTNTGTTCNHVDGTITVGAVTGGTAPFTYSLDNGAFASATTFNNVTTGLHTVRVKDANGCTLPVTTTLSNSPGPTDLTLTSTNATCGNVNGSITVTAVTGGTAPYTYSLNGGTFTTATSYTALAGGAYYVTVQDANGCTFSKGKTILNQPAPTAINFTFRHTGCTSFPGNTGFISITNVVGGTAPYTYSFNGSGFTSTVYYNSLGVGTYTLVAQDVNGCTTSQTVSIIDAPDGPGTISVSTVAPSCGLNDGSITITGMSAGTPPYEFKFGAGNTTYTSNTTYTGLAAGYYPIIIRDASGCTSGAGGQYLTTPGGPSGLTYSFTNSTCQQANGSLTVTSVSGGVGPYQYSLNGSAFQSGTTFNNVEGGVFMPLVVRDSDSCTFTYPGLINNTGAAVQAPLITQNGFLLTSTAPTGNQWFLNGVAMPGETGQTHFAQVNGSYTVTRTSGGCTSPQSAPKVINNLRMAGPDEPDAAAAAESSDTRNEDQNLLTVPESAGGNALTAYPNPNDGTFTLSFNASENTVYTIEIVNVFGQVVFAEQVSDLNGTYVKQLDLSESGAGIYTVVLSDAETRTVQKIVTH